MNQRRPSNKLKQKQLQTKFLEEQTKKMEEKLNQLKKQVEQQKLLKVNTWKKITRSDAPLKNYAQQILQQQKQAYKKFGIDQKKIMGTKTFTSIKKRLKQQNQEEESNTLAKIPSLIAKKSGTIKQAEIQQNDNKKNLVQSIQNNFFKAKIDVKNLIQEKTVLEFLQEIFLQQYHPLFIQNNITQFDDLKYLTQQQLHQMGIPKGHQIKITKKIQEEFDKAKMPTKPPLILSENQGQNIRAKLVVQMGYGDSDVNQYAEVEHHKKELEQIFDEVQSENVSENEDGDTVLITVPLNQIASQTGIQSQDNDELCQSLVQNCFNCYKRISYEEDVSKSSDNRNFCCQNCLKIYKLQMQKTCPSCQNDFFKPDGYYEQGLWLCSIGCCPNKDQIQEMLLEWIHKKK